MEITENREKIKKHIFETRKLRKLLKLADNYQQIGKNPVS